MMKKITLLALALLALVFASAQSARAGTEIIEPKYAPAPKYNYTPPPPAVYYAPPPPVRVVVYPTIVPAYRPCPPRFVGFGYQRVYGRRAFCGPRHWR